MGKLSINNIRKTVSYLKRNGLKETLVTVKERLKPQRQEPYTAVSGQQLEEQKARIWQEPVTFSILVPAYHTPERYFREMIESVRSQTYPHWQLVIGDAGEEDTLAQIAASYGDERISYHHLSGNRGIADNTNETLQWARGDYIALLDHDDLLAP
ncbi:MAG: glycosyltransferase, partial [Lachnospiraceae bacterium]|nr:glycosyltransferase [Lachnospiraceae bacterium]